MTHATNTCFLVMYCKVQQFKQKSIRHFASWRRLSPVHCGRQLVLLTLWRGEDAPHRSAPPTWSTTRWRWAWTTLLRPARTNLAWDEAEEALAVACGAADEAWGPPEASGPDGAGPGWGSGHQGAAGTHSDKGWAICAYILVVMWGKRPLGSRSRSCGRGCGRGRQGLVETKGWIWTPPYFLDPRYYTLKRTFMLYYQ